MSSQVTKIETGLERSFIGYYRYGSQIPSTKVFKYTGTLRDAIERFRVHCETMGYKFIICKPFLVDLDDQERRRAEESTEEY